MRRPTMLHSRVARLERAPRSCPDCGVGGGAPITFAPVSEGGPSAPVGVNARCPRCRRLLHMSFPPLTFDRAAVARHERGE
ncbi:MAG: hypothetical protein U0572_00355 [Phycisphaerales bacterium]